MLGDTFREEQRTRSVLDFPQTIIDRWFCQQKNSQKQVQLPRSLVKQYFELELYDNTIHNKLSSSFYFANIFFW